jgi:hypothetical protein
VRSFWLTKDATCGKLALMAEENTVQVIVSMRVKCWCGYANEEDFLLDMPLEKAQPMQAHELSACPDCGAPIRIHLIKRTNALH